MSIVCENLIYNTMPNVMHFNGRGRNTEIFKQLQSERGLFKKNPKLNSDVSLVTATNGKGGTILIDCCKECDYKLNIVGGNIEKWHNILKVRLIKDFIDSCETKYIMSMDAADVVIAGDLNIAATGFQAAVGTKRLPVVNEMWLAVKKESLVAGSATYTSDWINASKFARVTGYAIFNEDGTLTVEQSANGNDAHYTKDLATTGGTGDAFSYELVLPFVRIKWANGSANDTTTHNLYMMLKVMS